MDNSAIRCDEIVESCEEETKTIQQILMKRKQSVKQKVSLFYLYFY